MLTLKEGETIEYRLVGHRADKKTVQLKPDRVYNRTPHAIDATLGDNGVTKIVAKAAGRGRFELVTDAHGATAVDVLIVPKNPDAVVHLTAESVPPVPAEPVPADDTPASDKQNNA